MKSNKLFFILLLLLSSSVFGQAVSVTANKIKGSATAPSGSCSAQQVQLTTAGVVYVCASGTWASSGGGTTINSTNGQVPYRSNSTTFADSGIAYSSGMIGIQVTPTAAQLEINSQSTTRPSLKLRALAATGGNQATFENYDASGTRTAYIQADGSYVTTGNMSAINLTATYYNFASNRGYIQAPSNGVFTLLDTAGTSFGRLQIGGADSSYPSLKRSSAELQIRLADDSGFAAEQSLYLRYGSGTPEGAVTAPVGAIYSRTDGGAGTSFYVKESGSGNTGWVAK